MNKDLTCLRDPANGSVFMFVDSSLNSECGHSYPIIHGIPRFVSAANYSNDFGEQWNRFPKTQLDSFTGLDNSEARLARCLWGNLKNLKGKKVLEAGSGLGNGHQAIGGQ